jgi:putative addiction module killer protein
MTADTPKKIKKTKEFGDWQRSIKDSATRSVIDARIKRVQYGMYGDVKPVGEAVSELRVDHGPGYRVYFTEAVSGAIVLLLVGGNKSTQTADIKRAKQILHELKQQQAKAKAEAIAQMKTVAKGGNSKGGKR